MQDTPMPIRFLLIALAIYMFADAAAQAAIVGKPRIIDGDTVEISGTQIRLFGLDAPEPEQTCLAARVRWYCGRNAAMGLSYIVGSNWLACRPHGRGAGGRMLAICHLAGLRGPELNSKVIAAGWAVADGDAPAKYVALEAEARQAKRGIWRGRFVTPWDWRQGLRLDTGVPRLLRSVR